MAKPDFLSLGCGTSGRCVGGTPTHPPPRPGSACFADAGATIREAEVCWHDWPPSRDHVSDLSGKAVGTRKIKTLACTGRSLFFPLFPPSFALSWATSAGDAFSYATKLPGIAGCRAGLPSMAGARGGARFLVVTWSALLCCDQIGQSVLGEYGALGPLFG